MMHENDYIRLNAADVKKRVEAAAAKSGRTAEDIVLVAVTKTVEPDKIITAFEEGLRIFGENRVQELARKFDIIKDECKWHLIGHLQTNKVKYISDKIAMIHSVDSLDLAKEINLRAGKAERVIDILVQVNVSGEESKSGIAPGEVRSFLKQISSFKNIKVKGLMTMAPYAVNPDDVRYVFGDLRKLFIDIQQENIDNIDMQYLSMGMSNDFEVAIEEGANMVRIGTAIFGDRK